MSYKLKWSKQSVKDMKSLYVWIYERNKQAAKRIRKKIEEVALLLTEMPEMGVSYEDQGVRKHPVQGTEFTIFYLLKGKSIVVLRVRHQSLEVPRFVDDVFM